MIVCMYAWYVYVQMYDRVRVCMYGCMCASMCVCLHLPT